MGTKSLLTHKKTTLTILALLASLLLSILNPLRASAVIPGTPVEGFSVIASGGVYATAVTNDGTLYIGGYFTLVDDTELPDYRTLVRILPNGEVDNSFDVGIDNQVTTLEVSPDGETLFVGGFFNEATGSNGTFDRRNLVSFSTDDGVVTAFDPRPSGYVHNLEINAAGTTVYVAGEFTTVNSPFVTRNRLAAFDTSTGVVSAFNPNLGTRSYALALDEANNTLYVGGQFVTVNGGTTRRRLAAFNTSTGTATAFNPNIDSSVVTASSSNIVYSLLYDDDSGLLYVGGSFTTVNGGTVRNRLAALSTSTGTATAFDPNLGAQVEDLALDTNDQVLYASGTFTTVNGGTVRNRLAAFDTTTATATSFDPNPDSPLYALSFDLPRKALYTGGDFTQIGGIARNGLAAFQDPDLDNDGTPNTEEQAAPNNGDANNDSIPDSQQANVTSILNTDSNEYVTIVSPSGTTLSTTTAEAAPTEAGFTHLFGLTGFTISGVTPGDTIEVSLFYPNPNNLDPTDLTPKKYFPSTTSYQDLPTTAPTNTTITEQTIDGQPTLNLTYNLTDGGDYDLDNTADGQITDPVSLASTNPTTTTETTNTSTSNQDTLAETGQSQTMILITSMLLVSLATTAYTYRKRQDI